MPFPSYLSHLLRFPGHLDGPRYRCFADGVSQRQQVIAGMRMGVVLDQPQNLPAAWGTETFAVLAAQVVGMWLGVGSQRTQDGSLIGVDVGEGGRRRPATCSTRTPTEQTHQAEATCENLAGRLGSQRVR